MASRRRAAGAALAVGSVLSYLGFVLLSARPRGTDADLLEIGWILAFLLFALVGCSIVWHRPDNPLGWLLTLGGLSVVLSAALEAYAYAALVSGGLERSGADWAAWTANWLYIGGWAAVTTFPLLLLPGGHLPSSQWRPVAILTGTLVALTVLVTAFKPGALGNDLPVPNPVGLDGFALLFAWLEGIVMWALLGVTLLGLVALVARWRRAWGVERRRLAWPLLGALTSVALVAASFGAAGIGVHEAVTGFLVAVALNAFPVSIAVAILREGLLDIELVLRRTLIYTVLSAVIVGSYVVALSLASRWFAASADVAVSILATVLVALVLGSLKTRLELWVSRALFGHRDRPQEVLAALVACAERHVNGASLLRELESELRSALRFPYVGIRREAGDHASAPPRSGTEVFALVHAVSSWGIWRWLGAVRTGAGAAPDPPRPARRTGAGAGGNHAARRRPPTAARSDRHRRTRDRRARDRPTAVGGDRRPGPDRGVAATDTRPMGLASSIEELAGPLRDAGVVVELDLRVPDRLDPATEVAACRITAEALTNVLRHSGARGHLDAHPYRSTWHPTGRGAPSG